MQLFILQFLLAEADVLQQLLAEYEPEIQAMAQRHGRHVQPQIHPASAGFVRGRQEQPRSERIVRRRFNDGCVLGASGVQAPASGAICGPGNPGAQSAARPRLGPRVPWELDHWVTLMVGSIQEEESS